MPHIQITMLKGRTIEQKRKIAERVTNAVAEEAKTAKEGVIITILEVAREDYAHGGVLMADNKKICVCLALVTFEELDRPLMRFRFCERRKSPQVAALAGLRVLFAGIESVLTGL